MGPDDEYGQHQGGYPPQQGGGYPPAPVRTEVNVGRLWAGGVAAAVVAALVGLVGVLVVRAIFQLASSAKKSGTFSDDATVQLCVMAAVAALLATGLAHLLLVSTPSPLSYFGWIVGLLTVAAVVAPFLSSSSLPIMLAEAIIHLVLGVAIGGLVSNAAAAASRLTLRG
ncbi:DUF6069 family protein [Pseudonocardia spinosispora]|uniref:DUF6069 family protein n=1 Tax=Pseudonocardia spinosispora TaxID=103441 RepID=UPI0004062EFE|nr:DUF6069 family protein [Pseudonocardia spinosispora]